MEDSIRTEQFLLNLKKQGRSSPAGIHWASFCKLINSIAECRGEIKTEMPTPLILGGSVASNAYKQEWLGEQLPWAATHNCLDVAISHLERMDYDKWNVGSEEKWELHSASFNEGDGA